MKIIRPLVALIAIAFIPLWFTLFNSEALAAEAANKGIRTIDGEVEYIIDGDSLMALWNGNKLEVRLWGIDSPEYDQPGAGESKTALKNLALGQRAILEIKYRDRYGRHVAVLICNGLNVNEEMIATGNSWVYSYYCREPVCRKWQKLQAEAQKNRWGLWKGDNPIPPWQWKANR